MKSGKWIQIEMAVLMATSAGMVSQAAEPASYTLDPVVVTANRVPEKLLETNASVSVITRKDLENNHYQDLTEALRTVPGVTVTRYGAGAGYEQSEGVAINGSPKVLVLIDGTRANMNGSEFSVFSFGALKDLDNIERIEVLKGSASTLYGSDAKGGVINIITKKAGESPKSTISLKTGSYDTESYRFGTEGKAGNISYVIDAQKDISGDYKDANGLKVPSHLNASTWNAKLYGKLNDTSDLTFAFGRYTAKYMYSNTNQHLDERHYGNANNTEWRTIYNAELNDHVKNQLSIYDHSTNTFYDGWLMDLQTIGFTEQITANLNGGHELVAGMEYYKNKIKDYKDQMGVTLTGKSISSKAFFLQDRWDLTDRFNLTGGLRYTDHSMAGGNTSWSATAGYHLNDATNVWAGYKEYFVSPTIYQYFSPYGNEDLKPENGHTYDIGISHQFDPTLSAQLHAFWRKSKDVIAFGYGFPVTLDNPYGGRYVNVDRETAQGWDMTVTKAWENFTASAGYTHIEVKSRPKNGEETIDRYTPNGEWHINLDYTKEKLNLSLLGHGVIDRKGEGKGNYPAFPSDSYWVWDVSANYKATDNVRLYAKVNNLFNQFYAEHSNVKWGNPDEWYTSPGRNYLFGVEYTF